MMLAKKIRLSSQPALSQSQPVPRSWRGLLSSASSLRPTAADDDLSRVAVVVASFLMFACASASDIIVTAADGDLSRVAVIGSSFSTSRAIPALDDKDVAGRIGTLSDSIDEVAVLTFLTKNMSRREIQTQMEQVCRLKHDCRLY